MKKILLIGGGSGISELFTELVQVRSVEVSALVSVFDSGGSTGRLRASLKIPAVGDLRKVFSSATEKEVRELLELRLPNQHALGNLVLAFLAEKYGFKKAVEIYRAISGVKEKIIPVSFDSADLMGTLENGEQIIGEHSFDQPPESLAQLKVQKIQLSKKVRLNPAARKLLQTADLIVVGPGSLFGSLLVHFAIPEFVKAFQQSRAEKILIVNGGREFGYHGESAEEITKRFPVSFDRVLTPKRNINKWNIQELGRRIIDLKPKL